MSRLKSHRERHYASRIGWLRAAVLGANDGIVSIASLIVGVAAAATAKDAVVLAGAAGLVAGAMSMAVGEYISVSSQSDTEKAELSRERAELSADPEAETQELADIYVSRGLSPALALEVAVHLSARDALTAHARDELGILDSTSARPIQAAMTSAATFAVAGFLPLIVAVVVPAPMATVAVTTAALLSLAVLGAIGAQVGGAGLLKPVVRVTVWGAVAMAITAVIGRILGVVV